MNDDFNTPKLIAEIFTVVKLINKIHDGKESFNSSKIKSFSLPTIASQYKSGELAPSVN